MRTKLNKTIYSKLLLIAEEAKERGMTKLASGICEAIGSCPADEVEQYSYAELQNDIHKDIWKIASRLMVYYDLESVNAEKLDQTIIAWAAKMTDDLEVTLDVDTVVKGPNEPKVPGEDK